MLPACVMQKLSSLAIIFGLFVSSIHVATTSFAASFEVVDDEAMFCMLKFSGGFQISAPQGGGKMAPIWVSLNEVEDAKSGKELRLEVDTGVAKQVFLGQVAEYSGWPEFEVPPSLIGYLTQTSDFNYKLEDRATIVVKDHLTSALVKKFEACLVHRK